MKFEQYLKECLLTELNTFQESDSFDEVVEQCQEESPFLILDKLENWIINFECEGGNNDE